MPKELVLVELSALILASHVFFILALLILITDLAISTAHLVFSKVPSSLFLSEFALISDASHFQVVIIVT